MSRKLWLAAILALVAFARADAKDLLTRSGGGRVAPGGISFVQGKLGTYTGASAQSSISLTMNSAIGAGHTVICMTAWAPRTTPTISVSDGTNTYTVQDTIFGSGSRNTISTFVGTLGSPTTITTTFTGDVVDLPQMACVEYSGPTSIDGHAGQIQSNPGSAANAVSSNVTTASNNDTIVGLHLNNIGTNTITAGTGYTARVNDSGVGHWDMVIEDGTQSTAGNIAATFTASVGTGSSFLTEVVALH
jgi:hypothetical protein